MSIHTKCVVLYARVQIVYQDFILSKDMMMMMICKYCIYIHFNHFFLFFGQFKTFLWPFMGFLHALQQGFALSCL